VTPDEAARLLAACAAFDNRQPSEIAKRAWAKSLHDVPLDQDCFDAVARYYGTPPKEAGQRLWIQPHDVRTHRQAIRNERLENFTYDGDPDETPAQYLARRRAMLDAVASGRIAAPDTAPALTGGPHRSVTRQLEGIGRPVPDAEEVQEIRRPGPLGVDCPQCKAPIGRPCKTVLRGKASKTIHPARRRVAKGEPAYTETADEIEQRRQSAARLAHQPDPQAAS
jgi:hypothetical protein